MYYKLNIKQSKYLHSNTITCAIDAYGTHIQMHDNIYTAAFTIVWSPLRITAITYTHTRTHLSQPT